VGFFIYNCHIQIKEAKRIFMVETPEAVPSPCHVWRWRAAFIACLLIMVIGTAIGVSMFEQFSAQINHLQSKVLNTAQIKYVSVLMDDQHAPAMLVTQDLQDGKLQIQRLNAVAEGREDTLQLWAVYPNQNPISLGILKTSSKTLQLPADDKTLAGLPQLAISVEDKGGAEQGRGPRLPYLFTGAVVQKTL
jgi:anti-sigma-K factor RskA